MKLGPTGADLPLLGTDGPALLISSSGLDLSILPSFNNVVISSPFKVSYSIKPFAFFHLRFSLLNHNNYQQFA